MAISKEAKAIQQGRTETRSATFDRLVENRAKGTTAGRDIQTRGNTARAIQFSNFQNNNSPYNNVGGRLVPKK